MPGRQVGPVLPDSELTSIRNDLCRRTPMASAEVVDNAIRRAIVVLAGVDTAPPHLSTLIRRHAETTLGTPP